MRNFSGSEYIILTTADARDDGFSNFNFVFLYLGKIWYNRWMPVWSWWKKPAWPKNLKINRLISDNSVLYVDQTSEIKPDFFSRGITQKPSKIWKKYHETFFVKNQISHENHIDDATDRRTDHHFSTMDDFSGSRDVKTSRNIDLSKSHFSSESNNFMINRWKVKNLSHLY